MFLSFLLLARALSSSFIAILLSCWKWRVWDDGDFGIMFAILCVIKSLDLENSLEMEWVEGAKQNKRSRTQKKTKKKQSEEENKQKLSWEIYIFFAFILFFSLLLENLFEFAMFIYIFSLTIILSMCAFWVEFFFCFFFAVLLSISHEIGCVHGFCEMFWLWSQKAFKNANKLFDFRRFYSN